MGPNSKIIDKLVLQIVRAVHPLRIILFGSAARGDWHENSDVDLMVVVPDGSHCRKTAQNLYLAIHDIGIPFDLVVATPSVLDKHGLTNNGLIYQYALREGKDIYAA